MAPPPAPARAAAGGEHAVLGREEEGGEEDQRLQHDDDAAGRAVEEVADIGADEARHGADGDAITISRGKRSVSR